ncbi:thiamine pyrophosphate-binding protein [Nocardioides insulae]|uniref:thiamine pyrophosphate-binding protein n=1 Tax=Nocardioides insulae TaxID=394734 RepID=UPI00040DC6D4|nr:thiamine pyrophosphate-dependent enzyme [Nocardioides insulae]
MNNVGGDVLALVQAYGVDTVFGIPGTHNLEFYRHLAPLGLKTVTTRHEQGAGYAADGWAQQTGLPGVVITTSGPGLLNVLSAAGTAYAESRPLLILSPGAPRGSVFGSGALHETKDPVGAAGAVVEWSRRVTSGAEALEAVHDAVALFAAARPRPVHIEIPLDVLESDSKAEDELRTPRAAPPLRTAAADVIAGAAEALRDARTPVIVAGGGAVRAAGQVRALAELLDAPVLTSINGKGVLPESHPLAVGAELRLVSARRFVEDADAVLVIGSKMGEAETWFEPLRTRGTVVRIDLSESQLDLNLAADLRVHADARTAVPQLISSLAGVRAARDGAARVSRLRTVLETESAELAPVLVALSEDVAAALPADAVVAGDSSQVTYLAASSSIRVERPGSFLYMPTYATLGYGLPAAIGAKLASPERPVVCLLGDGALMFSVQELITAVEQGLDLVVVCVENGGYGEIRQNELDRGIPPVGVELVQPDWAALVEAFGGTGVRVRSRADLGPQLRSALEAGGLWLLHVSVALYTRSAPSA